MHATIAIPTHNRASEPRATLQALAQMRDSPGDSHEILVVDNGTGEETARVVDEAADWFTTRLRTVREELPGLSHARNRAIAENRGEILAFLDDDVDVDPHWFAALCGAFRARDAAAVGGRIDLSYPSRRPWWLRSGLEPLLSKLDHGDQAKPVGPYDLFGGNIGVRSDWIERTGGFRTDLGRIGGSLRSSEEPDFLKRIEAAGGMLWYEPHALVRHRIRAERLNPAWFLRRAYWQTHSDLTATSRAPKASMRLGWNIWCAISAAKDVAVRSLR
jgi:glycosyltransferase involved in cell wall biosynthesis